jgi:hypothetical protein
VQLALNIERIRLQKAIAVGLGVQSANSPELLDYAWADAAARDPAEAEVMHRRNNQARLKAMAMRDGR